MEVILLKEKLENSEFTEEDRKRFWRKLLGYQIGEEVTITYEIPIYSSKQLIGSTEVFLAGKIVGFGKDTVILETAKGVTITIEEAKILDINPSTKKDLRKLGLYWGETYMAILKELKKKTER